MVVSGSMETVLVVGVFDLFHSGHVRLLRAARALGDRVVVVVNGDRLTSSYKRTPIMNEDDRMEMVEACRYVDLAEVINNYSIRDAVVRHGVTQIVHGDDWEIESYKRQICCDDDFLDLHNARLVLLPYTQGISTSDIISTCADRMSGQREKAVATDSGGGQA
jgi:glycerol-3-phosphate cytidylyltransferase